jgi:hypothetical protein
MRLRILGYTAICPHTQKRVHANRAPNSCMLLLQLPSRSRSRSRFWLSRSLSLPPPLALAHTLSLSLSQKQLFFFAFSALSGGGERERERSARALHLRAESMSCSWISETCRLTPSSMRTRRCIYVYSNSRMRTPRYLISADNSARPRAARAPSSETSLATPPVSRY